MVRIGTVTTDTTLIFATTRMEEGDPSCTRAITPLSTAPITVGQPSYRTIQS